MARTMRCAVAAMVTVATAWVVAGVPASAQDVPTLPPPDASRLSPQVRRAIGEFERIVAARDLPALERHIADDAKMSFGGGSPGAAGLREIWEPRSADTALWRELDAILRLGGVEFEFDGTHEWHAPYPSFAKIEFDDPFQALVVTGTRVALRAAPEARAQVVARVDHAVLTSDCEGVDEWHCVRWQGRQAYVSSALVRSPVDHRLALRVTPDDWDITFFVAGD